MEVYAVFFDNKGNDLFGSDSLYRLDGRNTLHNMIIDSVERANRLKNVKKNIGGFRIVRCSHLRDLEKGSVLYTHTFPQNMIEK